MHLKEIRHLGARQTRGRAERKGRNPHQRGCPTKTTPTALKFYFDPKEKPLPEGNRYQCKNVDRKLSTFPLLSTRPQHAKNRENEREKTRKRNISCVPFQLRACMFVCVFPMNIYESVEELQFILDPEYLTKNSFIQKVFANRRIKAHAFRTPSTRSSFASTEHFVPDRARNTGRGETRLDATSISSQGEEKIFYHVSFIRKTAIRRKSGGCTFPPGHENSRFRNIFRISDHLRATVQPSLFPKRRKTEVGSDIFPRRRHHLSLVHQNVQAGQELSGRGGWVFHKRASWLDCSRASISRNKRQGISFPHPVEILGYLFDLLIHFAQNILSRGFSALVAQTPEAVPHRTSYFACAKSPRRFGSIKVC